MKKVCAVVVTYNRKELLIECIDSILNQDYTLEKLIIVDNNSTDGTKELLKEKRLLDNTIIDYMRLNENTGGAGGFYAGMKRSSRYSPDWVWIMDDDVVPNKDALTQLIKAHTEIKENVSFLASAVRGIDGEAMNVPKIFKNQFFTYTDWYKYLDKGNVQIVKATFVSLLINGEAIKKCGYPWKEFFIWGDDSEYTQRIIRDYGPAYLVGKSIVLHKRKGSDELSLVKETNENRIPMYFYYYRNNLINFWEYEGALYRFLILGKLGLDFFLILFKSKNKWEKIKVIFRAFFAFLFGTYDKKSFRNRAKL